MYTNSEYVSFWKYMNNISSQVIPWYCIVSMAKSTRLSLLYLPWNRCNCMHVKFIWKTSTFIFPQTIWSALSTLKISHSFKDNDTKYYTTERWNVCRERNGTISRCSDTLQHSLNRVDNSFVVCLKQRFIFLELQVYQRW